MFSPYYAAARARAPTDPCRHVTLNVALYGAGFPGWAMTERNAAALDRTATTLTIGPSTLVRDGDSLLIDLAEVTCPIPRRLRGRIRVQPAALFHTAHELDPAGRHRWTPIAPSARVEVDFAAPAWRWSGQGYFDHNEGDAPLEQDFSSWNWSRAPLTAGRTAILYQGHRRDASPFSLALTFGPGGAQSFAPPPPAALPAGFWGVARSTNADSGATPRILRRLEDSPFYTRSVIATSLLGQDVTAIHESLSLDRFRKPWVRALLPFRMPRRFF